MWSNREECGKILATHAVAALIDEAALTPKPGLVDLKSSGSHSDMNIQLMLKSAKCLRPYFEAMASEAYLSHPSQHLREKLAVIGREAECRMLETTGGVNTHRGAIWALGLLVAAAAICGSDKPVEEIAAIAGTIARFPDRYVAQGSSNGMKAMKKYRVGGARGEAMNGFPHLIHVGLPALRRCRLQQIPERYARLDTLLTIMANLDDTCLLHRGGLNTLHFVKSSARRILHLGGSSSIIGRAALTEFDIELTGRNASPGGSADLLAAVLFTDSLSPQPSLV